MEIAPGHFLAFERNNIKVVFFTSNCTSWKQPCDVRIIAALKKWYKYLKDVLNFSEFDVKLKALKEEPAERLPVDTVDVVYGDTAHLLNAAQFR